MLTVMNTIDLARLSSVENLHTTSLYAMKQFWRENQTFVMNIPRKQSALLWFCGSEGEFSLSSGEKLHIPLGALVSIPMGAQYSLRFFNNQSTPSTILIEFCLFDANEPFTITKNVKILIEHLEDMQIIESLGRLEGAHTLPEKPRLHIKSELYKLLDLLARHENRISISKKGLKTIEKGINYLTSDEKQLLSIEEVARLCFVTPAYFRRLFKEYTGFSPSDYRNKRKTERAKELISRTDISVAELSELLGYDTPSYFCRVFKKETGLSPSQYKKTIGS